MADVPLMKMRPNSRKSAPPATAFLTQSAPPHQRASIHCPHPSVPTISVRPFIQTTNRCPQSFHGRTVAMALAPASMLLAVLGEGAYSRALPGRSLSMWDVRGATPKLVYSLGQAT
eukprot:117918-Chlamydomonas_euryale.AAC.1